MRQPPPPRHGRLTDRERHRNLAPAHALIQQLDHLPLRRGALGYHDPDQVEDGLKCVCC